jgi:hypothetical protein
MLRQTFHQWSAEAKQNVHRNVMVNSRFSFVLHRLLLSVFDRWRRFQCVLRKARYARRRIDCFQLGMSFRCWAQYIKMDIAVKRCKSSADEDLAGAKINIEIAAQRVSQLEQELVQCAEQAEGHAAESDFRADERVQIVEDSMQRRIEVLRQESQARIIQVERAADVRYQQLLSKAKSDVENTEQMLAARSLESRERITELREETEAALRTARAELATEQSQLKQERVDLQRQAAEELADLESAMSKRCAETERQAEHLVSKTRVAADEIIRRQQRAIEQTCDRKLAALQQKHLGDMESVDQRVQEEIRQYKSDSDKKLRDVLSEAAQYQQELVIATDRADAAENQLVVRPLHLVH